MLNLIYNVMAELNASPKNQVQPTGAKNKTSGLI
jgi:hypothetical protein